MRILPVTDSWSRKSDGVQPMVHPMVQPRNLAGIHHQARDLEIFSFIRASDSPANDLLD